MRSTLALMTTGYAWLPDRRRHSGGKPVRTRLLGKNTVAIHGPDAVRFFYDERHIHRHGALPAPVLDTLFGRGAVHTLDGPDTCSARPCFCPCSRPGGPHSLTEHLNVQWDHACARWADRDHIVLFEEASALLTRAVCGWSGIPLADGAVDATARDLVAMVDGFASVGPRHVRARLARSRREARIAELVHAARRGTQAIPAGPVLERVAAHRDADGRLLKAHTAAVEVLNVIRPTVAVTWFLTFVAHALNRWPEHRRQLTDGDAPYIRAFAHEIRRFYPFAPFVAGLAAADLHWDGQDIPKGSMVLLDLYGQNHGPRPWPEPYAFAPSRILSCEPDRDTLVPQGGGDPATHHRCPGEDVTLTVLETLAPRLATLRYDIPDQNLRIPLRRIPTAPCSGFIMTSVW